MGNAAINNSECNNRKCRMQQKIMGNADKWGMQRQIMRNAVDVLNYKSTNKKDQIKTYSTLWLSLFSWYYYQNYCYILWPVLSISKIKIFKKIQKATAIFSKYIYLNGK